MTDGSLYYCHFGQHQLAACAACLKEMAVATATPGPAPAPMVVMRPFGGQ